MNLTPFALHFTKFNLAFFFFKLSLHFPLSVSPCCLSGWRHHQQVIGQIHGTNHVSERSLFVFVIAHFSRCSVPVIFLSCSDSAPVLSPSIQWTSSDFVTKEDKKKKPSAMFFPNYFYLKCETTVCTNTISFSKIYLFIYFYLCISLSWGFISHIQLYWWWWHFPSYQVEVGLPLEKKAAQFSPWAPWLFGSPSIQCLGRHKRV